MASHAGERADAAAPLPARSVATERHPMRRQVAGRSAKHRRAAEGERAYQPSANGRAKAAWPVVPRPSARAPIPRIHCARTRRAHLTTARRLDGRPHLKPSRRAHPTPGRRTHQLPNPPEPDRRQSHRMLSPHAQPTAGRRFHQLPNPPEPERRQSHRMPFPQSHPTPGRRAHPVSNLPEPAHPARRIPTHVLSRPRTHPAAGIGRNPSARWPNQRPLAHAAAPDPARARPTVSPGW